MYAFTVAPFAGAWIEIGSLPAVLLPSQQVAPFAGAWIEIPQTPAVSIPVASLPSRERGLKFL